MKGAREFWIFHDSAVEYKHYGPQRVKQLGKRQTHVIEYSAYEQECAKRQRLLEALREIAFINTQMNPVHTTYEKFNIAKEAIAEYEERD